MTDSYLTTALRKILCLELATTSNGTLSADWQYLRDDHPPVRQCHRVPAVAVAAIGWEGEKSFELVCVALHWALQQWTVDATLILGSPSSRSRTYLPRRSKP